MQTVHVDSFDLGRLSDYDFEVLCKDLFEKVLGMSLEIFPRGKDGGVDLRHMTNGTASLVIQCKHWARSGRAKLISHMRDKERPKIVDLAPDRYILATTVDLTADAKDTLKKDLAPYVGSTEDLYGIEEIVAALRDQEDVVRNNFRLWLSSTAVLQGVLHKEILVRSSDLLEDLDECAQTFVPTPAFERARELLEARAICLLAGIPGIGKTTLAKMLARIYVANGYQLVEVSRDVEDMDKAWLENVPQVFYFDDFLGETTLDHQLNRNEDSRLLRALRRVQETPDKRLILTTREYILAEARRRYAKLDDADLDLFTYTIEPDGFTEDICAKILYNHVHYSALPLTEKRRFARPDTWSLIVRHPNFNPRLVERTLRLAGRGGQAAEGVADELIRNLDNPKRLWEHIINEELDHNAVHLLEVLFSYGYETSLEDLHQAWGRYQKVLRASDEPRLFHRSLKVLQGSMIEIRGQAVDFHNSSIRDYMRVRAGRNLVPLLSLIESIENRAQIIHLISVAAGHEGAEVMARLREHAPAVVRAVIRTYDEDVETPLSDEDESWAGNLDLTLEMADDLQSRELAAFVVDRLDDNPYELTLSHDTHVASLASRVEASDLIPTDTSRRLVTKMLDAMFMDGGLCGGGAEWQRLQYLDEVLDGLPVTGAAERRQQLREEMRTLALQELGEWQTNCTEDRAKEIGLWGSDELEQMLALLESTGVPEDFLAEYEAARAFLTANTDEGHETEEQGPLLDHLLDDMNVSSLPRPSAPPKSTTPLSANTEVTEVLRSLLEHQTD